MKVSLVIQYIFFKYKLIRSVFIHFLWKITFFTVQLHIK
jgi:cytochrome c oxidase subunit IV